MSALGMGAVWALAIQFAAQTIVGGEPTGPGEFDSVVAIQIGPVATRKQCTGTLVADGLILTAAHCLTAEPILVNFGDVVDGSMSIPAADWATHPDFCPDCDEDIFDYAYIRVDAEFSVTGGIPLPLIDQAEWDDTIVEGGEVLLVGFGEDGIGGPETSGIKRKVTAVITDLSDEGFEFRAGGDGRDTCGGDSGGPAFVRVEDGTLRLAGITSRGSDPCGDGGFYGAPYPALCWLRDETDVDLLPPGCGNCDCLDTTPDLEGSCGCDRKNDPGWGLLCLLLLIARRPSPHAA